MENKDFRDKKEKAKEFYENIGQVWSPQLGENVVFNKIGFQHLIRKGGKKRSKPDQLRRFALLKYAAEIIKNPAIKAIPTEREINELAFRHGKKVRIKSNAQYWSFQERRGDKLVTAIVQQVGHRQKHFLSIYDKNKKQKNQKTVE